MLMRHQDCLVNLSSTQYSNSMERFLKFFNLTKRYYAETNAREYESNFVSREMIESHEWYTWLQSGNVHLERLSARIAIAPEKHLKNKISITNAFHSLLYNSFEL